MALLENLQREDLNPMEEARAYQRLQAEFQLTQDEVAQCVGGIARRWPICSGCSSLSPSLQDDIEAGRLSMGHARALLALDSEEAQQRLRDQILAGGLSVRDTENRCGRVNASGGSQAAKSPYFVALKSALHHHLGTQVAIKPGRQAWQDRDRLCRGRGVATVVSSVATCQLEASALPPSEPP